MISSKITDTFSLCFLFLGRRRFMPLVHCKISLLSTHMSDFTLLSSPGESRGQYSCQTIRHRKGQHLTYPYSMMDLLLRVLGIGSQVGFKVWDWWVGSIRGPNNSIQVPFAICSKLRQISIILEWKFGKFMIVLLQKNNLLIPEFSSHFFQGHNLVTSIVALGRNHYFGKFWNQKVSGLFFSSRMATKKYPGASSWHFS